MQTTLDNLVQWTENNKMKINEQKSSFMIFSRSKTDFKTRLSMNQNELDQVKTTKLLGVHISEDLSWAKNCQEICKRAYSRIGMLSKLKYAGMKTEDLVNIYILHIRSVTEYCSTAFHNSLTVEQDQKLEAIQKVALRVILGQDYLSYEEALSKTSLVSLNKRRQDRCIKYALKASRHPDNMQMFPPNTVESPQVTRNREKFHVNFAHTESYRKSAIPSLQWLLNDQAPRSAG